MTLNVFANGSSVTTRRPRGTQHGLFTADANASKISRTSDAPAAGSPDGGSLCSLRCPTSWFIKSLNTRSKSRASTTVLRIGRKMVSTSVNSADTVPNAVRYTKPIPIRLFRPKNARRLIGDRDILRQRTKTPDEIVMQMERLGFS